MRVLVFPAAVALVLGLAPAGPAAQASPCYSKIQLFFYHGAEVPPGVGSVLPAIGCSVGGDVMAAIHPELFTVPPGARWVVARDNVSVCDNIAGSIVGLGAGDHRLWEYPKKPDGTCYSPYGTGGASTPLIPIDPTARGTITASTANGSTTFKAIVGS